MEYPATTEEKAARKGTMRRLYDTKKKLAGKYLETERPIEDKYGKTFRKIERCGWDTSDNLYRTAPLNLPDIEQATSHFLMDVTPQTIRGISVVIKKIKCGRAVGSNILAEALRSHISHSHSRTSFFP